MRSIFFLLLCSFSLANCQTESPFADENPCAENQYYKPYASADIQKLRWLAGSWQGEASGNLIRQTFLFHNDQMLEVISENGKGNVTSLVFSWVDGRYYYGVSREWIVTWIGEKDIRFDPVGDKEDAMTWTRLNDRQWYLIRHTSKGDRTTLMERAEDMQP
ncbi:MAG: hypothetical protein KDC61_14450 [Saprospiraceae bacterium]|nr:hypothetical protein [Saprospiraceae bacterium]MCB9355988.1 hypothetical protein [Lewinellaceae bacterium]